MEEDPPASTSSSSSLSPADRARRDRESEAIRRNASSPFVVLHSAMKVHEKLGNETAQFIHKKLMKDANSMDDIIKPQKRIQKLSLMEAVSLVTNGQTALSVGKNCA